MKKIMLMPILITAVFIVSSCGKSNDFRSNDHQDKENENNTNNNAYENIETEENEDELIFDEEEQEEDVEFEEKKNFKYKPYSDADDAESQLEKAAKDIDSDEFHRLTYEIVKDSLNNKDLDTLLTALNEDDADEMDSDVKDFSDKEIEKELARQGEVYNRFDLDDHERTIEDDGTVFYELEFEDKKHGKSISGIEFMIKGDRWVVGELGFIWDVDGENDLFN